MRFEHLGIYMSDEQQKLEIRKNLRLRWLWSLADISNIELQQRSLDKKITNPAWTYVEFMCGYFDDTSLSDGGYTKWIERGFGTQEEYNCIKDFHKAFDEYQPPNGDYDPAAILADPKWQKIVALVKKSINELATIITDSDEKKALFEQPTPLTEKILLGRTSAAFLKNFAINHFKSYRSQKSTIYLRFTSSCRKSSTKPRHSWR